MRRRKTKHSFLSGSRGRAHVGLSVRWRRGQRQGGPQRWRRRGSARLTAPPPRAAPAASPPRHRGRGPPRSTCNAHPRPAPPTARSCVGQTRAGWQAGWAPNVSQQAHAAGCWLHVQAWRRSTRGSVHAGGLNEHVQAPLMQNGPPLCSKLLGSFLCSPAGVLRQLLPGAALGDVILPAGKRLIHNLRRRQGASEQVWACMGCAARAARSAQGFRGGGRRQPPHPGSQHPASKSAPPHLALLQQIQVLRDGVKKLAGRRAVRNPYLDLGLPRQHIQLGEVDVRQAVDAAWVGGMLMG